MQVRDPTFINTAELIWKKKLFTILENAGLLKIIVMPSKVSK